MRFSSFARCAFPLALATVLHGQSTAPSASNPIATQTIEQGSSPVTLDLRNHFTAPSFSGPVVQFDTVMGRFNVELRSDVAPRHSANFLAYVQANAYTATFFHRSASLQANSTEASIIQGGGYRSTGGGNVSEITKLAPIALEYSLPNAIGTLAAARTSDVNSATSEWYFNVRDNSTILDQSNGGGYSVFGRVIGNGMKVVDAIAALPRVNASGPFTDLPVRNFAGGNITSANLVIVNNVAAATIFPTGSGSSVITFTATSSDTDVATVAVSGSNLAITPVYGGTSTIRVTATDTDGSTALQVFSVAVPGPGSGRAPAIVSQPQAQVRLASGTLSTVVLAVTATGSPAPTYQWRRNGVAVPGQRSPTYVLTNASEAQAGNYTCVVANSEGTVESSPTTVYFLPTGAADHGRLVNLSIRSPMVAGEVLTIGTVLGGSNTTGNKALLARAVGPALTQFGVTDVLPDPQITLIATGASSPLASNNDWGGTNALQAAFAQVAAFAYASGNSKDAALLQPSLAPGGYTLLVSDAGSGAGEAIAELYDSTPNSAFNASTPRLVNVSVRKLMPEGAFLTAGFVIGGATAKTVLVRAIGPALAAFGVSETMADPQLTLFNDRSEPIAANDNWGGSAEISAIGASVGAFPIANANSNDAILLLTLAPGNYSARLTGKTGGGDALIEIYEVP